MRESTPMKNKILLNIFCTALVLHIMPLQARTDHSNRNQVLHLLKDENVENGELEAMWNHSPEKFFKWNSTDFPNALMYAIFHKYNKAAEFFLNQPQFASCPNYQHPLRCLINQTNKHGRTALHLAIQRKNVDMIVKILNTKNIDTDISDHWGRTPYEYAAYEAKKHKGFGHTHNILTQEYKKHGFVLY
jgi:hypothetical protein